MSERNYQFRQRMLQVHKPNRRMDWARPAENQIEIDNSWTLYTADNDKIVIYNALRDFEEYLCVSMGVCVRVQIGGEIPEKAIIYGVDNTLEENQYRISASNDKIELSGFDDRACAQASFYLEDEMNLFEAPFVDLGKKQRKPLYSPRMVHSGFGLDMFPENHMRNIAHAGINALLIFVTGVDMTPYGYQDFNDLIYRANQWGIDVYAYSYMLSRVYPEGEIAERFYEEQLGTLFERCPGFKGIIFVGESCEFPTKDPHTNGVLRRDNMDEKGNYIIKDQIWSGWWPCSDFPLWLNMIKRIIRSHKPDADIVFWTYNWGYVDEKYRLELLRNIPTDISLLVTFEMFEDVKRDGINNRTVDYTLFFEGPGKYFTSEAKLAKERGIRLYSMTNTGGLTWDVGTIPYEPAPYQWMRRYKNMNDAHYNYGLCGTMDSHHYGFYPSFISDLAKKAFCEPIPADLEAELRRLCVRDFSEETADKALEAYQLFSDGIRMLISTNEDQYGPFRIGPSYPLILFDDINAEFPSVPWAPHGGNEICNPVYQYDLSTKEQYDKINYEIKCHTKVYELYEKGCEILEEIIPCIHHSKRQNAELLVNMCRFIANAAKTTVNVKKFKIEKEVLENKASSKSQISDSAKRMLEICQNEKQNALSTIPLVEFDSRLGYEPSMEYMCDKSHIEWKLEILERVMTKELPKYFL